MRETDIERQTDRGRKIFSCSLIFYLARIDPVTYIIRENFMFLIYRIDRALNEHLILG